MMKNLPKIKRNKFNHVHKLMKYICLSNPIEICADYSSNIYENKIRKKSNTVGTKVCTTTMPPLINYKYHYKSSINLEKLIDIPDGN